MKVKNKDKIIVSLCGGSGAWEKDYRENGYTVFNITLPEYDVRNPHISGKYMEFWNQKTGKMLSIYFKNVYGILAAPPCTQFSNARTTAKVPRSLKAGMDIVVACLSIIWQCQYRIEKEHQRKPPLKFWALENPYGRLNWFLGKPAFIFNPWEFGDGYSKKTCLWGHFNEPSKQINFRFIKPGYENITSAELRKIHKSKRTEGSGLRSITPAGFARSFYEANK